MECAAQPPLCPAGASLPTRGRDKRKHRLAFLREDVFPMTSTTTSSRLGALLMAPVNAFMRIVDIPLRGLQKASGIGGMAAFFLAPNMLIFGIFVLLPLVINFVYSMTGGTAFFLSERNFVGAEQYQRLFTCTNYLDPMSCQEDAFWTAVGNTFWFVVLQVTLMIA